MRRRTKILLICGTLAAVTAFGGWAAAQNAGLRYHRGDAERISASSFEETVRAVDALAEALHKSVYATDGGMCARVCGEAYAEASAAGSAMLALPFATQELEQLAAFLNIAGDYAISLCPSAAAEGFSEEELAHLRTLSDAAADFSESLRGMQQDLNAGDVRLDSREKRLRNVGEETGVPLSARLLDYQAGLTPMEKFSYDGRYGCEKTPKAGYMTEEEMQRAAADFLGIEPDALTLLYRYEGSEGRRCYRFEDSFLCVSRRGVESMSRPRLVSDVNLSEAEGREAAESFLTQHGYEGLVPAGAEDLGGVLRLRYCSSQDGADCPDNAVTVSVALDDGSICGFSAEDYCSEEAQVRWLVDEGSAAAALPESLTLRETRRLICKSPGQRDTACYAFFCQDAEGRGVTVYVDAATGRQCRIEF